MAGWRDQLRPASFRGVPFVVVSADGEHGRRLAPHEYPLRDDPWHEDMGRKFRSFSFEAFVLEPGHIAAAQALIDACETAGSGKLVHPWIGEMEVVLTGCRVRFSHAEGGMASFSLSFAEAGQPVYPSSEENAVGAIDRVASEAKDEMIPRFLQGFSVDSVAGWIADGATELFTEAMESLGPIGEGMLAGIQESAAWVSDITGAVETASEIVRDPTGLAKRVLGLTDVGNLMGEADRVQYALTGTFGSGGGSSGGSGSTTTTSGSSSSSSTASGVSDQSSAATWRDLQPMTEFGLDYEPLDETTASRRLANANAAALSGLIRRAAIVEMARLAVTGEFETTQDAQAATAAIHDAVDREIPLAGDEEGEALHAVATTARRLIARKLATLPTLITITAPSPVAPRLFSHTPSSTIDAIVLAYAIYGDDLASVAGRADQIVNRNKIWHAGFIPGGSELELVSVG